MSAHGGGTGNQWGHVYNSNALRNFSKRKIILAKMPGVTDLEGGWLEVGVGILENSGVIPNTEGVEW